MYRIIPTARFRKDLKRAAKRGLPMGQLENIVDEIFYRKFINAKILEALIYLGIMGISRILYL